MCCFMFCVVFRDKKQRDRQSFTGSSAWQHTIPELNEKAYHPEW